MKTVPLGEWLPDQADVSNAGLSVCENTIPTTDGYKSHPGMTSNNTPSEYVDYPHGAIWVLDSSNERANIVGGVNGLWVFDRFQNRSVFSSSSFDFHVSSGWEFTRFIDHIIFASYENRLQRLQIRDGLLSATNTVSVIDGQFPAEPRAPRARRCATVGNHIVVGDTLNWDGTTGDTVGPNFVQWCGHRNYTVWGSNRSLLADFQPLEGVGGRVQKIIGGTTGFVFQQHAVRAMTPVAQKAFQIQVIKRAPGTDAPKSVVESLATNGDKDKGTIFYYSWGHFLAMDMASGQTQNLSEGKISEWFKKDADISGLDSMQGIIDRRAGLVMWAYSTNSLKTIDGSPYNDSILYYHMATGRFTVARMDTTLLFEWYEKGYLLDEIDDLYGDSAGSVDAHGDWLVDDPWLEENALQVAAYDTNSKFASITGEPLQARFETGDASNGNNKRLYTNAVRPIVDKIDDESNMFVQIGKRNKLNESHKWTDVKQVTTRNSRACVRANSKYQKIRLLLTGRFEHAKALELYGHSRGGING